MVKPKPECSICCENLNKSTHLSIDCKGCEKKENVCRTCAQTFILNNTGPPTCMMCKSEWDREFMCDNLTKVFVEGTLKDHIENIRVENEISRLPETQVYANARKQAAAIEVQIGEVQGVINRHIAKMDKQRRLITELRQTQYQLGTGDLEVSTGKSNFTYKCLKEECKGFLDSSFKCGLCDSDFCKKCMAEIEDEDHKCNKDDVETFKAIKKDTKPCPSCGEMIFKIDGCDQMWCVKCHTSFSWRTGTIAAAAGANHNPEYFRWLRENGQTIARNPDDVERGECGQEITELTLNTHIRGMYPPSNRGKMVAPYMTTFLEFAFEIFRLKSHIEWGRGQGNRLTDFEPQLREYRIQYLLDAISKDEWKKHIQIFDKLKSKQIAIRNVWMLVQTVITELINRIFALPGGEKPSMGQVKQIYDEAENIRKYANDTFIKISKNFTNSVTPGICRAWREINNIRTQLKRNPATIYADTN